MVRPGGHGAGWCVQGVWVRCGMVRPDRARCARVGSLTGGRPARRGAAGCAQLALDRAGGAAAGAAAIGSAGLGAVGGEASADGISCSGGDDPVESAAESSLRLPSGVAGGVPSESVAIASSWLEKRCFASFGRDLMTPPLGVLTRFSQLMEFMEAIRSSKMVYEPPGPGRRSSLTRRRSALLRWRNDHAQTTVPFSSGAVAPSGSWRKSGGSVSAAPSSLFGAMSSFSKKSGSSHLTSRITSVDTSKTPKGAQPAPSTSISKTSPTDGRRMASPTPPRRRALTSTTLPLRTPYETSVRSSAIGREP
mmetsp:Transcript_33107/g.97505  ORF Transcript_33107/g.97505 Transcript_33107/m.97505 type:complete len:307 (-) Transcript_33107:450-1370(-)